MEVDSASTLSQGSRPTFPWPACNKTVLSGVFTYETTSQEAYPAERTRGTGDRDSRRTRASLSGPSQPCVPDGVPDYRQRGRRGRCVANRFPAPASPEQECGSARKHLELSAAC